MPVNLSAFVDGVGLLGPGLAGWEASRLVLTGHQAYVSEPTVLPLPQCLPAAERRRTGRVVKLALAVGLDATAAADVDPATLPSVFASSGGDGHNCHEICQTLASPDPQISPTRFHNSVHNAAAGYWSIATRATSPSNVLCAFDASFAAGLLEAVTQVTVGHTGVLLVTYDAQYPPPLFAARPIPDAFGFAAVLSPTPGVRSLARVTVSLAGSAPPSTMSDAALESVRIGVPAARSLPLLRALALQDSSVVNIDYLDGETIAVEIAPCH